MAGSREQALRAVKTNLRKHGPDYYSKIGQMGGKVCVPKGFAINRQLASEVGKIGGANGRRGEGKRIKVRRVVL